MQRAYVVSDVTIKDLPAVCERRVSRLYEPVLTGFLKSESIISRSQERPLPTSRCRDVYTLSAPAVNDHTWKKKEWKPPTNDFSRHLPLGTACVD